MGSHHEVSSGNALSHPSELARPGTPKGGERWNTVKRAVWPSGKPLGPSSKRNGLTGVRPSGQGRGKDIVEKEEEAGRESGTRHRLGRAKAGNIGTVHLDS